MVRTIETINDFGMKETLKMKNKSLKYQLIKINDLSKDGYYFVRENDG